MKLYRNSLSKLNQVYSSNLNADIIIPDEIKRGNYKNLNKLLKQEIKQKKPINIISKAINKTGFLNKLLTPISLSERQNIFRNDQFSFD